RRAFPYRPQDGARERREKVLIEDEIAEAERDELALVPLEALDHVRVVADDEIGARVDRRVCNRANVGTGGLLELEPRVELDDHEIARGFQLPNRARGCVSAPRIRAAVPAPRDPILHL